MLLIFLAIGLAAGVLSGLFGIGGGIVIVPALLYFARMQPATATGTSLAALLLPVGALGAWEYHRNGHVEWRASLLVAGGWRRAPTSGRGSTSCCRPVQAKRAFAVFLAVVAVRLWVTAKPR
jgi:uncharacterized membrane protein YfcA